MTNLLKNKKRLIFVVAYIITLTVCYIFCIDKYIGYIEKETTNIDKDPFVGYLSNYKEKNDNGFYELDIKKDLAKFIAKKENFGSIIYKVKDENFYFELEIIDGSIDIKKLVDNTRGINARINYFNIESMEYQKGNINDSLVIKINSERGNKFLAITNGTYYFLGVDVDNIVYKDNQFYYISYNSKYEELRTAQKCDTKTKELIEDFNYNDYYYKTGDINFLKDFYQKIKPSYYYVKNRCDDLKNS